MAAPAWTNSFAWNESLDPFTQTLSSEIFSWEKNLMELILKIEGYYFKIKLAIQCLFPEELMKY